MTDEPNESVGEMTESEQTFALEKGDAMERLQESELEGFWLITFDGEYMDNVGGLSRVADVTTEHDLSDIALSMVAFMISRVVLFTSLSPADVGVSAADEAQAFLSSGAESDGINGEGEK